MNARQRKLRVVERDRYGSPRHHLGRRLRFATHDIVADQREHRAFIGDDHAQGGPRTSNTIVGLLHHRDAAVNAEDRLWTVEVAP